MIKENKESVKNLFANIKETLQEQTTTPIQMITPVQKTIASKKELETPFTLYIPTNILKNLKIKSANDGISIKDLVNNAIQRYYNL